jgi:hypothetical protein
VPRDSKPVSARNLYRFMNSPRLSAKEASIPASDGGWVTPLLLSLLISLMIVAPFFWRGNASGHDFEFHATSWLDVAGQWKQGVVYPRWTEWANHGFGEPRFIFYPPLSWLLGSALSFVIPWDYVPSAFIILVQTFAGLSAFAFGRRLLPQSSALFAAACYTANPNALLIIYFRSDFAELLASAFFPLLFLAALQLSGLLNRGAIAWQRNAFFFSAILAAVWLANAPAAVMATYSVTLLFLWLALTRRTFAPIFAGAAGLALAFGLAAFYIFPAAYEQRWVNIAQVLSTGLLPTENFLYTAINDPEHTWFNYIASTIAVAVIALTGITAIAAHRQVDETEQKNPTRTLWTGFLVLAAVATALMLRPSLLLWQLLPKLRFVQFPWRWMSILTIPLIYYLAAAFSSRKLRLLWIVAFLALSSGAAVFLAQHTWWDDEDMSTLRASIASGEGFDGTDEYDPVGDDHYNLPAKSTRAQILPSAGRSDTSPQKSDATPAQVVIQRWTSERKGVRIHSEKPVRLALRLLNYPAWQVEVNGSRVQPQAAEDSGQMIIPLAAGHSDVTVRLTRTWDRTAGIVISIGTLLCAISSLFLRKRNTTKTTTTIA